MIAGGSRIPVTVAVVALQREKLSRGVVGWGLFVASFVECAGDDFFGGGGKGTVLRIVRERRKIARFARVVFRNGKSEEYDILSGF